MVLSKDTTTCYIHLLPVMVWLFWATILWGQKPQFPKSKPEIWEQIKNVIRNQSGRHLGICKNIANPKNLFACLQKIKQQIETNPDPQLIKASLMIAHLDHTMEQLANRAIISDKFPTILKTMLMNYEMYLAGRTPEFTVGLNKLRLKRFAGARIAEFNVTLPEAYHQAKKWPLLVIAQPVRRLDGYAYDYGSEITNHFIIVQWFTTFKDDRRWKDFQAFFHLLTDKLNVDQERIYLYGHCENGIAAMSLALHYPDFWSGCEFLLGNSFPYLAGNALNLPFYMSNSAHRTEENYTAYFNFSTKCFRFFNCHNFKSHIDQPIRSIRGTLFPEALKIHRPDEIQFTIDSLKTTKAYWAEIIHRQNENFIATINASIKNQTVYIQTDNISVYTINLRQAPVDIHQPVNIVENGKHLGIFTDIIVNRQISKPQKSLYVKNKELCGPIQDIFTEPYILSYKVFDDDIKIINQMHLITGNYNKDAPCIIDADLTNEHIMNHNIVLVGNINTHNLIKQLNGRLPVHVTDNAIVANNREYKNKDIGYIFIYPNPLNPKHYIAVFSALSDNAFSKMIPAYRELVQGRPADIGIYEVTKNKTVQWHIREKFDANWNWHPEFDRVWFHLNQIHPSWQWQQWLANFIRKQCHADIVICDDFLNPSFALSKGPISYRDIFNAFQNKWLIKIRLHGKDLRNIILTPLTKKQPHQNHIVNLAGINILSDRNSQIKDTLRFKDIQPNKKYTIVLPYRFVNGQQLGFYLNDYEIIDQTFLMPLLRDYFDNQSDRNFDHILNNQPLIML